MNGPFAHNTRESATSDNESGLPNQSIGQPAHYRLKLNVFLRPVQILANGTTAVPILIRNLMQGFVKYRAAMGRVQFNFGSDMIYR